MSTFFQPPQGLENNILLGSRYHQNCHPGNVYYRKLIADTSIQYLLSDSKGERGKIINRVIHELDSNNHSMLIYDSQEDKWVKISHKEQRHKISQALGDRIRKHIVNPIEYGSEFTPLRFGELDEEIATLLLSGDGREW